MHKYVILEDVLVIMLAIFFSVVERINMWSQDLTLRSTHGAAFRAWLIICWRWSNFRRRHVFRHERRYVYIVGVCGSGSIGGSIHPRSLLGIQVPSRAFVLETVLDS